MEMLTTTLYDNPKYYDLLFGSDWKAEFDFLKDCFDQHASRRVARVFEPACGTGRLMMRLAAAGYEVSGNDLNAKAVAYCNRRLARHGFAETAIVADMSNFKLRRKVDAAFNTINSFRHLATERAAESHLRCMAAAIAVGGIYVLGFHLTPVGTPVCDEETWSARRGHLGICFRMQSLEIDRRRRQEQVRMTVDVYTPTQQFRIVEEMVFRTYQAAQFLRLLGRVPQFELVATYDFAYDTNQPIEVDSQTEDVVYILKRVSG